MLELLVYFVTMFIVLSLFTGFMFWINRHRKVIYVVHKWTDEFGETHFRIVDERIVDTRKERK